MFHLYQVIAVRRDMPDLIQVPVQGSHAVGIAMYMYALSLQKAGHPEAQFDSADAKWGHPSRIWKGVQSEKKLREVEERVKAAGVPYAIVVEPDDGPLKGQATALATWPGDKEQMTKLFGLPDTYELKFDNIQAFKDAALQLVIKQLQAQIKKP